MNDNENKIIFCNIGWMNLYNGIKKDDKIISNSQFIKENNTGGEIYNFSNSNGICYGFVYHLGQQMRIEKIGAKTGDKYVDGVLVIWLSHHPNAKGVRIVGWYKNARVYREFQKPLPGTVRAKYDYYYNIIAGISDTKLLPIDERTFIISKASKNNGGIGQSNIWYAKGQKNENIVLNAINYIENCGKQKHKIQNSSKSKKPINIESRILVETNAIKAIWNYYEELGYTLTSVEKDNVGWDLEARLDDLTLKIEIKGVSGNDIIVYLTPNEYEKMKIYRENYRLCIVTNVLDANLLKKHIFTYNQGNKHWIDNEDNILNIEEKIAAKTFVK